MRGPAVPGGLSRRRDRCWFMTDVAIHGARGYAGQELVRILMRHPHIDTVRPVSRGAAGERYGDQVSGMPANDLIIESPDAAKDADIVFLATPDATATKIASDAPDDQLIVDLSRAHRQEGLAPGDPWRYGWSDVDPVPEGTRRIANPGCYPTSAMIAMAPLIAGGHVGSGPVIVDGKSGTSGAGITPTPELHFSEANESVRAYKVDGHDHGDEIQSAVRTLGGAPSVRFTPHIVPQTRGLLTTCYLPSATDADDATLREVVREHFADTPFVHVVDEPRTGDVTHSNQAHVAIHHDTETGLLVARCAIDNLQKGAAGTAVQNMNHAMGWDPAAGLEAHA